MLKTGQP